MSWPIIIIILFVGLALIALEIVALPGGVSGILGGIMVALGIWQTYANHGATAGNITLITSIVVGIIMLVILMKSGTWKRFSLKEESDGQVNTVDSAIHVGSIGTTISRLAPAGKALFGDSIVEVHSDDGFIDENTAVEVTEIQGYQILVKTTSSD
ncbi:MAG: NfeD family protein [Bacteroidales bacterium]|nr:NfeD family protein [Bacteroidales bacterium]